MFYVIRERGEESRVEGGRSGRIGTRAAEYLFGGLRKVSGRALSLGWRSSWNCSWSSQVSYAGDGLAGETGDTPVRVDLELELEQGTCSRRGRSRVAQGGATAGSWQAALCLGETGTAGLHPEKLPRGKERKLRRHNRRGYVPVAWTWGLNKFSSINEAARQIDQIS